MRSFTNDHQTRTDKDVELPCVFVAWAGKKMVATHGALMRIARRKAKRVPEKLELRALMCVMASAPGAEELGQL